MDPSSVITQVTPDNNDASHLFTVQKGNGVQQKGKIVHSNIHMCLYNSIKWDLIILWWGGFIWTLWFHHVNLISETKKRSNLLCSIICCLGKNRKGKGKKGRESSFVGKGIGGSGASGSGDLCLDSKQNSQSKSTKQLLPEIRADDVGKKCIVIDLDETLVHSSFKVRSVQIPC